MATSLPGGLAPINPVAATQVGVSPADATRLASRSQYLAEALRQMAASGSQNIRSPAQLGVNLLAEAVLMHGKRAADQQTAQIEQQIAQRLYPNDSTAQLRWLVDPQGMNAAAAKAYEPMAVKQGESVGSVNGGFNYTAPVYGVSGDTFYQQGPQGVNFQGNRAPSYSEQTAQAAQAETGRHNIVQEGIDLQKIPIELGMMRAALGNAATNAGNLGLNTAKTPEVTVPQGYLLDQVPGR